MRIGVDAGCLGISDPNLKVGVYQVAKNLLIELGRWDTTNTYFLYSFYPIDTNLLKLFGPRMKNIVVRPSKGWMKLWLPVRLLIDRIDVFLGMSQALPLVIPLASYRSIAFVYDVAFEHFPDMYPDSFGRLHQQTERLSKYADHIIAISQTTKDDLVKQYGVSPEKISVAYLGVRMIDRSSSTTRNLALLKEKVPYFLFVGALKRIKNVATLITAFVLFLKKVKKDYMLVIVGGTNWYDPAIDEAMQKLPEHIRKKITFKGFVTDEELTALYTGTTAFVSPSFYEGFGLSFVEAMAVGCPVIGSTAGAIPEVVGKAGLLVSSLDARGLADKLYTMATDTRLRTMLQQKGKERAKDFTWENFAKKVLTIVNKVQ